MKAGCLCLTILLGSAASARAQMTWTDKGYVNVTFGAQSGSRTLPTTTTFPLYDETATVTSAQSVKGGSLFDIGGGYKVWSNLALGVSYSWTSNKDDATVNASVPDPVFFDRPRAVTTTASDLKHTENVIHITGTWMIPVTDKFDVGLLFGPSIFMTKQELPTGGITVAEPGPQVTVKTAESSKTRAGYHLGIDATYLITPKVGAGVLIRFARATATYDGASESIYLGGFQIGGGLRLRF